MCGGSQAVGKLIGHMGIFRRQRAFVVGSQGPAVRLKKLE